jgi:hypothetical protein
MSEMTITHQVTRYSAADEPSNCWTGTIDGITVAQLWTDLATGEIGNIETTRGHERQGYATALYRHAAARTEIFHAPVSHRSVEGNAWAERVGGPSLTCDHTCYCYSPSEED